MAVVLVALAVVLVHGPWSGETTRFGDALSTFASFLAAACCLYAAAGSSRAMRWSWALFGSTMLMWTVADLLWSASSYWDVVEAVIPAANLLYILGLAPMVLGLLVFPVGKWERGAGLRLVLDALVLGSALLLISQVLVLREVVVTVGATGEALLYGVYPVTDILLAGLAALLVLRSVGRPPRDLVLIGLAFAVWTVADNGFALQSVRGDDTTHTFVAVLYVAAPLALALAALSAVSTVHEVRSVQRNATGTLAALLPDLMALGAAVLCVVNGLDTTFDWVLAAATLALTALRQVVLTSDNHRLRQSLETRVADRTQELQRLSDRHQHILESVGEGIYGVDESGRISFLNPAAARMLGWDAAALLGRDACTALCAQEHDECTLMMVLSLRAVVTQAETEYTRRDGTRFTVEITAAPRVDADGDQGAVVVFRDITERHVVDLMKQEFVSTVSHELRTPLTAIRGSLELLADGAAGELPDAAHEIVAMAERGTERLSRLVNDIIDIERLEDGSFKIEPRPTDIASLVQQTTRSLATLAEQGDVDLVVGDVGGHALCDPDRVVQALVNLVGNALKFTPPGGRVDISAAPSEHEVTFSISDEGRGIPDQELEQIFERFHQVASSDANNKGGAGLGLTITRSIVERHGGRIWAQSEVGTGSTFRFTLPLVGGDVARSRT
ncbi:MAG: sensor signal transduction histidine kinase [Marmoricola sp.]|nr:sensor signal transduction histidine kinase [Marmoricola sp.]